MILGRTLRSAVTLVVLLSVLSIAASTVEAAIETREVLKTFFQSGDKPTQQQFGNLIDSFINLTDDGLTLYGIGVTPSSTGENYLRVGKNVGINELLPDTDGAFWKKAPVPNIPPIPGMCPSFCGTSHGFLPLQYVGPDGTSFHYGFLQISMEAEDPVLTLGGGGVANPDPAIFVTNWAWETTPGATLTTFVPEPATAAMMLVAMGLLTTRRPIRREK